MKSHSISRLLFITLAIITCNSTHAQGFMKKILKGNNENKEVALDTIAFSLEQGITFYPYTINDNQITITGNQGLPNTKEETIFINTLLYSINKAERGKEHILAIDFEKKEFSVIIEIPSQFYKENSTYYKYKNTFSITGATLSFAATEMYVYYNNIMGDLKEISFDNLNPSKKAKHKNYVNELTANNSIYLSNLFDFIQKNVPETIKHWNEIQAGKIVKGMNTTECLLSVGKPMHIRKNGNQIKWMVNNDFVVIFENGSVINTIR